MCYPHEMGSKGGSRFKFLVQEELLYFILTIFYKIKEVIHFKRIFAQDSSVEMVRLFSRRREDSLT